MNRVLVGEVPGPGGRVTLDAAASHHLLRVQRVARGAAVHVADGRGAWARAVLVGVDGPLAVLEVVERTVSPPAPARVLLLGLPKPPAAEEAVTLATEAGATRIVLVVAERSPPGRPRPERLARVVDAAVTQCGRAAAPIVEGPVALADALTRVEGEAFVATLPGATRGAAEGGDGAGGDGGGGRPSGAVTFAVGPEGGFSAAEQALLEAAGFRPLVLGPHILRTPTAVAVGLGRLYGGPAGRHAG